MPRSMHLPREIYPNLKSISELFKMYMKSLDSFNLASRDNWVSCKQTLGCLRLYGDIRVARAYSLTSMLMRYCCSIIGCNFFLDIIGSQKHIATGKKSSNKSHTHGVYYWRDKPMLYHMVLYQMFRLELLLIQSLEVTLQWPCSL